MYINHVTTSLGKRRKKIHTSTDPFFISTATNKVPVKKKSHRRRNKEHFQVVDFSFEVQAGGRSAGAKGK